MVAVAEADLSVGVLQKSILTSGVFVEACNGPPKVARRVRTLSFFGLFGGTTEAFVLPSGYLWHVMAADTEAAFSFSQLFSC